MKYYKYFTDEHKPTHGQGGWQPMIEDWYHVLELQDLPFWAGQELWEVEPGEEVKRDHHKTMCRTFRRIRQLRWDKTKMVEVAKRAVARARARANAYASCAADYAACSDRATCAAAAYAASAAAFSATDGERAAQLLDIKELLGEPLE